MTTARTAGGVGATLRTWRHRSGMSQLDLAIAASTTQRHVSFVEQGRSAPGRTLLLRLAEAVAMPLQARNDLLLAAGYAPAFSTSPFGSTELDAVRGAVVHVVDGFEPYPAIVVDRVGTIVLANTAAGVLYAGAAAELLRDPVNAYRLALHPDGLAPRIRNFAVWSQHVVRNLRGAARASADDALDRLVDELRLHAPPEEPAADHVAFAAPLELDSKAGPLRLITTLMAFPTSDNVALSEMRLEAFLPADAITASRLDSLAGRR